MAFGLCNAPSTFQIVVLSIILDLVHNCTKVNMDDFRVYGDTYEEALPNLERIKDVKI